jgi:hypothetical protein
VGFPPTGRLVVQGVTVSSHKFPGLMVSGQVVSYAPPDGRLAAQESRADPRAVFELWLYHKLIPAADVRALRAYCLENAQRLRERLAAAGIDTAFNAESFITLLARQPAWLIEAFNLSPEEDWVHFIAMPHVTPAFVDAFVDGLVKHRDGVQRTLDELHDALAEGFQLPAGAARLKPLDARDTAMLSAIAADLDAIDGAPEHLLTLPLAARLATLKEDWARGAMSFVGVDTGGEWLAVFFLEAHADRTVEPSMVLMNPRVVSADDEVADRQAAGVGDLVGRLLDGLHRHGVTR